MRLRLEVAEVASDAGGHVTMWLRDPNFRSCYHTRVSNPRRMPARVEVVDDAIAVILRRKSGAEKIRMVAGGWPLLRAMHAGQVRRAHPDWDESLVQAETSRRKAFG